jgi:phthalate 3,4-dioxygenase beta subunit
MNTGDHELEEFETALAHDDPRHRVATHLLAEEAAMLDARRWDLWLQLMSPDVRYVMPVRVTASVGATSDRAEMAHFDEDRHSLGKRVERLTTEHAWTEDPPSRTRHLVTNVRTFATDAPDELRVESSLLLFRSRGDTRPAEILCAGRIDRWRSTGGRHELVERRIDVDESVLRTQNLAIFL